MTSRVLKNNIDNKEKYIKKCILNNNVEFISNNFKVHKYIDKYHLILSFDNSKEIKYYTIITDDIHYNKWCFNIPIESIGYQSDENGNEIDSDYCIINTYNNKLKAHYSTCYDIMMICMFSSD
ncbi:hypothetical protein QKU48_gp1223 [Fadolivirus algeromassiliense]|jgi:hypothetical protein|uniref:Uncharacterized protein n=1 Tax=Fadolivirus FV1/VV64 TaxID=3070911 RepID=A0A7D3R1Y0_9VIRU|nr:hypothetical protein QKU48_gp1223 [Fadolivirus algeromassiliense]QKF94681.1 hypothetical protein Fadolivirus_1_1223 [Fadolivirus FV1/VV64]